MKKLKLITLSYLLLNTIIFTSCEKKCCSKITFFNECIDDSNQSTQFYKGEYNTGECNVSFMFEIGYEPSIYVKEYQYSHSHDPNVNWTLATNVFVGQYLGGGVTCESDINTNPTTVTYLFTVPEKRLQEFPVRIGKLDRITAEIVDSTTIYFKKI